MSFRADIGNVWDPVPEPSDAEIVAAVAAARADFGIVFGREPGKRLLDTMIGLHAMPLPAEASEAALRARNAQLSLLLWMKRQAQDPAHPRASTDILAEVAGGMSYPPGAPLDPRAGAGPSV